MNTTIIKILLVAGLFGMGACNPGTKKQAPDHESQEIVYLSDVAVTKPETSGDKWPVVLFFDAQARGTQFINAFGLPLSDAGFGVVASNQWKNGTSGALSQKIVKKMLGRAASEGADMNQVYVAGFSGGGRFAQVLAQSGLSVQGVISLGAGGAAKKEITKPVVSIAGMNDFNLREVLQYALTDQYHEPDLCMVFDGGHEWPPADVFMAALSWCKNPGTDLAFSSKDTTLRQLNHYFLLKSKGDNAIQNNPGIGKQVEPMLEQLKMEFAEELKIQNDLKRNFGTNSKGFWLKWLDQIEQSGNSMHFQARVRQYMSLLQYMAVDNYIRQKQFAKAEQSLDIYRRIDPRNPDVEFLAAKRFLKMGKNKVALKKLNEAVEKGYNKYQIISKSEFSRKLSDSNDFILTLKQIYPDKKTY